MPEKIHTGYRVAESRLRLDLPEKHFHGKGRYAIPSGPFRCKIRNGVRGMNAGKKADER